MLRTYSLGKAYLGRGWAIHPLSGSLLKTSVKNVDNFRTSSLPKSVSNALKHCEHPYSLIPPLDLTVCPDSTPSVDLHSSLIVQNQFKKIKRWRSLNFFASILYASIPSICFQESRLAFATLNSLNEAETRDTCLEKCLTVAKCSSSFRKNSGVLFIGAHLPLQAMHAWIIEDGFQPDDDDRQWINFLPLIAITHTNSNS